MLIITYEFFLAFQLNDYLIIWRGLFYFMWMSDKPLPQVNNILFILIKHVYGMSIHLTLDIFYFIVFINNSSFVFYKHFELVIKTENY